MGFDYAGKIRALLARADHTNTPEAEAASARAMAFRLMRDYQIAEEEALAVDPETVVPTHFFIDFKTNGFELSGYYPMMARFIASHTGTRVNLERLADYTTYRMTFVGYEGDLRYAEFLWTSAHLMFSTKIDPRWDSARSDAENVYLMRQAGIKRKDIANAAGWDGDKAADRSKVQRMYLAQAKVRGEDPNATGLGFNSQHYRDAYANAFVTTLNRRLMEARDAADVSGGVVELSGRQDRVDDAFYAMFPKYRPSGEVVAFTDPTKDCAKCAKAATTCNDHKAWRSRGWSRRDELAYQSRVNGASARAGMSSGRSAAEGVIVARGQAARTDRVERGGHAIQG